MAPGCYVGSVLDVDLSSGQCRSLPTESLDPERFLGGRGFVAHYLARTMHRATEPLGEKNVVVIATGPATGTLVPTSGRFAMGAISPLTRTLSTGYCGGHWGAELKYAGYDGVLIRGRANAPCYLWISDGIAEVRDATDLWGLDVPAADLTLKQKLGPDVRTMLIGPAGENLVSFSAVMVDVNHAVGRGGLGAVFGSKNLKGIATRGKRGLGCPGEIKDFVRKSAAIFNKIRMHPGYVSWRGTGTVSILPVIDAAGILPTRNFQYGQFDGSWALFSSASEGTMGVGACFGCNIACISWMKLSDGQILERPEYETFWSFGPLIGNADAEGVLRLANFCEKYGLDTMEAGHILAFLTEVTEKGLIDQRDLTDLTPSWGDIPSALKVLESIIARRGIGDLLALGLRGAAQELGPEAERCAMHVKGFIMAGYDPRGTTGMALNYATACRGADHNRAYTIAAELLGTLDQRDRFSEDGAPEFVCKLQDCVAVVDSMVMCTFTRDLGLFEDYPQILEMLTGQPATPTDFRLLGERIINIERIFNLASGFTCLDDKLPDRLLCDPLPDGPSAGRVCHLSRMLRRYYELRGWNEEGVPSPQTLTRLGIVDLAALVGFSPTP